ncbi:hypothetical protein KHQ06_22435 [Nocardia tengchongensis]|uniref:Uncharacterized protein n=1 Tax=Nocardia tengchongensis TaxID=2055889 RepID=A0ABX8CIG0_9NOCA|nr:hypothetical protein [Nocardia tengchongensis]QVI19197.1 hypothetical protein KHQ06_22435 [Nocardia tengchongensis]
MMMSSKHGARRRSPAAAEIAAVWPDPSPLSEWWDHVMLVKRSKSAGDGETTGISGEFDSDA